ncbi:MAG TPA: hypothetical protein VIB08_04850, partial [Thermoanaerobaculia bacterium]
DGAKEKEKDEVYQTLVLIGNTGNWDHGAAARLVFEDGRVVDRMIPAGTKWVRYRVRYGSRLAWAAVDPDRKNPWDQNRLNDSKVIGGGKGAADTLGKRATAKYTGWTAFLAAAWTQLFWVLA